jgi:hypothetical protein
MVPDYQHRQVGATVIIVMSVVIAVCAVMAAIIPAARAPFLVVIGVLVVTGVLFSSLSVRVDGGWIECRFGPGLIRRRIPLSTVRAARAVRNRWWYGWGIRITPHGWLWNVSGLDAVELTFTDGRKFRVGTDEPEQLAELIRRRLPVPEQQ